MCTEKLGKCLSMCKCTVCERCSFIITDMNKFCYCSCKKKQKPAFHCAVSHHHIDLRSLPDWKSQSWSTSRRRKYQARYRSYHAVETWPDYKPLT